MSFNVDDYYKQVTEGDSIYSFRGSVTAEVINQILEGIEKKLEAAGDDPKIIKKVYNVLVESLQNLYHHVDELPEEIISAFQVKFAIISIKRANSHIYISTGNFIPSTKIKLLKEKIDKINSLSEEELKDMYKFILNHQKLSAKGGGGLGLIDIARKSGNKLNYTFTEYKNEIYFYNFTVQIN
jgi:hypothetical protein